MKNMIKHWANLYMESVKPEFNAPEDFGKDDDFDIQADKWEEVEEEKRKLAKELALIKNIKENEDEIDEVMDPLEIIKKAEEKKANSNKNSIKSVKVIEFRPEDGYVFAEVIKGNDQKQEVEMEVSKEDAKKEWKRLENLYKNEFKTAFPKDALNKLTSEIDSDDIEIDISNDDKKKEYLGTISLIRQEANKEPSIKDNIEWLVPAPDFDKVSYAKGKEGEKERKEDEKARKREMKRNASDDFAEINALDAEDNDDERIGKEKSPETDSTEDHRNDNDEDAFKDQENIDDYEVE